MLDRVPVSSTGVRHRAARIGIAFSLVLAMSAAILAQSDVRAQSSALLSLSTVTPADATIYAEVALDPENTELQQLDELLLRLGSDESLIEAIQESAEEASGEVDLTDAELAFVLLPSALESAAAESALGPGDLADQDSVTTELTNLGATEEGIAIVIRPMDIADFEAQATEEAGSDAEIEEYLGLEIVSYVDDDGDNAVYVIIDDFFIYATTVEDAMLFVDASVDGGESLAGVEEFAATSEALPAKRVAFAYMNGELLVDTVAEAAEAEDPTLAPVASEALSPYRAHIGAILGAEENGISLETVMLSTDGSAVEPSGSADDLTFADQMPADTVVFASGHDLGETIALQSLGLALVAAFGSLNSSEVDDTEATPVPMTVDEMYEAVAQFLGFNLKTDFIDQMTGPYAFGVWGVDSQDPAEIGAVLVSGVDDPVVVSDAIGSTTFLIQAGGQGEVSVISRTVGDATVNTVSFHAEGSDMSVDFGVVDDQFVLGLGDGVDTLLLGPDGSLADSPRFIAAMESLPVEYQAVQFVDVAALVEASEAGGAGGMMDDVLITPVAGSMDEVQPESFASVTYVEDGNTRTSAILLFP